MQGDEYGWLGLFCSAGRVGLRYSAERIELIRCIRSCGKDRLAVFSAVSRAGIGLLARRVERVGCISCVGEQLVALGEGDRAFWRY